jgi:tetratricopeptide (TPR) repeat protein
MKIAPWLAMALAGAATAGSQPPGRSVQVIDLAKAASLSITVSEGQDLEIRLENASPAVLYRVSTRTSPFPPRSRELPKPFDNGFRNYTPSPACTELKRDGLDLIATEDEALIATRVQALQSKLAASSCPAIEKQMVGFAIAMTRPSLREVHRVTPGRELVVTIEHLSADTKTAVRTWTGSFRGGAPQVGWIFPDEQTWIVREITQDIVEIVRFAKGHTRPAPTAPPAVSPTPHVWAPAAFAEWTRALMKADSLRALPARGPAEAPALARLTDLRANVIEAENQKVSKRLTAQALDARAHEAAAVVVGALALRESARSFSDTRRLLSRMTAHLAVAQALRGPPAPGPDGRLADALLATLVGRQVEALELLARMQSRPGVTPAERAWATALSMRNDGDWRRLREPAKATLIERIEYFRALARADSASRALEAFPARSLEDVPDWGRHALATSFSVEEGNRFVLDAIPRELEELARVWSLTHAATLPFEQIATILQTAPGRAVHVAPDGKPSIRVLDWGVWASTGARHVYAELESVASFLRHMLRTTESADAFRRSADATFGALPLYPLVVARSADAVSPPGFCEAISKIVRQAPESMTAINWDLAYSRCGRVAPGLTSYASWFSPIVPSGTTLDVDRRLRMQDIALKADLAEIERLRRLAPYNESVLLSYLGRKYGAKIDAAAVVQEFGRMAEYQVRALRQILEGHRSDPARYQATLEKMCAMSADRCVELGTYLVSVKSPEVAARAYQKAVDEARDRVYVANNVEWLVNYSHDRGESAKALAIATMAAEAYSEMGLTTMARYQERLKHYDEAERYYKAVDERYGEGGLQEFYLRYQARVGGDRFAREAEAARTKLFPGGLQKVALADLKGPVSGALITNPASGQGWGLRPGDLVVALDGYRVESPYQYGFVKALSDDPKMRLFVQRDGGHVELIGDRSHIVYFRREAVTPHLLPGAAKRP